MQFQTANGKRQTQQLKPMNWQETAGPGEKSAKQLLSASEQRQLPPLSFGQIQGEAASEMLAKLWGTFLQWFASIFKY